MLEECSWISITPTVHKLLGHTWELILENGKQGLGSLDESGLEACNKVLRRFRTTLSRKRSHADVLTLLWVNSDPILNVERLYHSVENATSKVIPRVTVQPKNN